jgi:hypothetical protein
MARRARLINEKTMNAFCGCRGRWTMIVLLFVLGHASIHAAGSTAAKRPQSARTISSLRCSDKPLLDILDQGFARSQTLRDLESRLNNASVIVYLSRAALPSGLAGRTRLMGAGGTWRFLSVEIDDRAGPLDLLTLIGHELQHVLEIADAAEVVDEPSFTALYRRIGLDATEVSDGHRGSLAFETRDAMETGRRVRAELSGWAWATGSLPRHS